MLQVVLGVALALEEGEGESLLGGAADGDNLGEGADAAGAAGDFVAGDDDGVGRGEAAGEDCARGCSGVGGMEVPVCCPPLLANATLTTSNLR